MRFKFSELKRPEPKNIKIFENDNFWDASSDIKCNFCNTKNVVLDKLDLS